MTSGSWRTHLREVVVRFLGTRQVRRILGVAAGSATAQAALLLASPLLTRLYTPDDFGIYSYFFATVGFLAPVATLRYELAIPVPESEERSRAVAATALAASVLMGLIALGAMLAGRATGVDAIAGASAAFIVGLPVGVTMTGVYQTATYWAVRHEKFRPIALGRSGLGVGTSVAQVAAGVLAAGSGGLIVGDVAGRFTASAAVVVGVRGTARPGRQPTLRAMAREAAAFRGFPLLSSSSALMNSLALYLPLFVVGEAYGAPAAGMLFLAQRVIGLPSTLLISAASQVYIAELTREIGTERVALYDRTIRRLAILTVLPFLAAALMAPPLFPIFFGAAWADAGLFALWLAPLYFFQLLSGATVATLDVLELHRARLLREAILVAVTVAVLALPFLVEINVLGLIGVYGGAVSLFYLGSIVFVRTRIPEPTHG